jgi:hypothetical protein
VIIAQGQAAVVQTRDGIDDAEPETDAAFPCTRVTAVKPVGDVGFFLVGYAGPIIGDDDLDLPFITGRDLQTDLARAVRI